MKLVSAWPARVALLLAGLVVAGAVAYGRFAPSAPKPELRTAAVQRTNITQSVSVSGAISPSAQVRLAFNVPGGGRIAEVFVKVGQEVAAGARVARLDDAEQARAVSGAEANVASAQARYAATLVGDDIASLRLSAENAQRTLDRLRTNYAAAKTNLDAFLAKASAERTAASSAVTTAQATLATLQADLAAAIQYTDVRTAASTANTLSSNLQLAQLHAALLDTALRELDAAAVALRAQIARYDGGTADVAAYNAAQQSFSATASRAQGAIDTVSAHVGNAVTNANSIITSLNTAATKGDSTLNTPRDRATQLVRELGTAQQLLASSKSALGATSGTLTTIGDAIAGAAIANAESSLASAQQSLRSKQNSRPSDIQSALASLQSAQTALEGARTALANTTLAAPAAGTIVQLSFQPGESVSANAVVAVLSTAGTLQLHGTIGEADVARLRVGQVATITIDAIGTEKRLTGKVAAVDPAATLQQGVPVYGIDIGLDVSDPAIRAGMTGTASVIIASKRDVLAVPNLAIRSPGGRRGVQVLKDGQPTEVAQVEFGISNEQFTEVVSGLTEGDLVVLPAARAAATPAIRFGVPGGQPGGIGR